MPEAADRLTRPAPSTAVKPRHRGESASTGVKRWVAGGMGGAVLTATMATGALAAQGDEPAAASPAPDVAAAAGYAQRTRPPTSGGWLGDREARAERVSRDSERAAVAGPSLRDVKRLAMSGHKGTVGAQRGRANVGSADLAVAYGDPRDIARAMIGDYGWSSSEFNCLDRLYISESGWDVNADNPTSSAYGIPQALPGEKMASAGADWRTNPATQIEWGLGYIRDVYGTPCSAMSFKSGNGWY